MLHVVWRLRAAKPVLSGVEGVSPNHRLSILLCRLRFRRGSLSFAWPCPRLCSSSVTNSTGFLLLFRSGRIALAPFFAFLTQLLLVQISLVLFIGKTTAETSGSNGQCRCNFYWSATRYHMPWAFRQRIAIRKRKLTTTRSTFMRHNLSYRDWLRSSNAKVAFVRANFTAGRGHSWEGGRAPRSAIEATQARVSGQDRGSRKALATARPQIGQDLLIPLFHDRSYASYGASWN